MNAVNNNKEEHKKRSKELLKNFDETFLSSPHFFPHFNLETCINASSPKARRGVSSLSLFLLFYCFSARGAKIYIERDERASLEPTRETEAIGVLFFY